MSILISMGLVIPDVNRDRFITEAVESPLGRTRPPAEGSDDSITDLVPEFSGATCRCER